jgi:hypothetical protein
VFPSAIDIVFCINCFPYPFHVGYCPRQYKLKYSHKILHSCIG